MQAGSQLMNQGNQQQHPFAMSNPNALAFATQQMGMNGMMINPMVQMQMGMASQFNNTMAVQSVMKNPSPGSAGIHGQGSGFMNMGGRF